MVPACRQAGSDWLLIMKIREYFVYVIKSQKDGRLYVGMSKNVANRLKEHNAGEVFSTKGFRPWELKQIEMFGSRQGARNREKYLKLLYNIPR